MYIYDHEGWALHNVGLYWSNLIDQYYNFFFIRREEFKTSNLKPFDIVFWGCSSIVKPIFAHRFFSMIMPENVCKYLVGSKINHISVVHDPCEIFPQSSDWKSLRPKTNNLKWFRKLGVISNEMKNTLSDCGYECQKINTASSLPIKKSNDIRHEKLRIFSKAAFHDRKNIPLFLSIKKSFSHQCEAIDGFFGRTILDLEKYINLIDSYNCYLCTSWQEGGPLPLMDAINRGCAILTTPVGQTDELIIDGYNGFFCNNFDDFSEKIQLLSNNPTLLYNMRLNSIIIAKKNNNCKIRKQLLEFLSNV